MTDAKRWFIADHAISDETEDQFAHNDVATQLADIVQSIEAPAAIGLLGGFGTGKSSIINLLQNQLKGHERFQVVALSAEKHTNVERQRAIVHSFAEALHDDAGIERKLIDPLLERTQTEIVEAGVILERTPIGDFAAKHRKAIGMAALKGAGIVLALYLLAAGVLALVDGLGWADTRPFVDPISTMVPLLVVVATLLGLGTAVPAWVKAALTPPSRTSKKPRIEAADEFERLFGDLADLCKKQLVIVVDDIDRLSPDQVLEALASVKTFQSIPRKPTIFILTCDERVIRQALASARPGLSEVNDSVEEAAEEYLNKLFVVRQPLPPHLGQDMTSFASAAMSRANHAGIDALGPNLQRVIDILVHDGVRDPRHVIRLLNAFFADYRMASVRENAGRLQLGEVTSRPALLARLTVLRSDFADFYERVTVEFPLLTAVDRLLLGETLDNEEEEIIRIAFANRIKPEEPVTGNIVPSDLRAFLRRTVQHVERDRPLHAFIYLGQTPAGRVLGSERSEQIRRSLENGDDTQLRARLAEGAEVAVAAVTHTIDSLKHARPGLPLENAVHAASGALDDAPDGARIELANELADVIDREESTTPSPDRLARVIRSAAHDYQQGLLARVADFAGDDDAALRAERAHVLVDLAVEDAKRAPLVGALSTYFTSLHADADWNVIPGWIETAAAIPVAAREAALGSAFYTALATLSVGAADDVSEPWRAGLATLFAESVTSNDAEVQAALLTALESEGLEPRRVSMVVFAAINDRVLDPARIVTGAAAVITDDVPECLLDDVVVATELIAQTCLAYKTQLHDNMEAGAAVMAALTVAVNNDPDVAGKALAPCAAAFGLSPATPIAALLAKLDEHRQVDDAVGTGIREALLAAVESLSDVDRATVVTGLVTTIAAAVGVGTPEANFGIESVRRILQVPAAVEQLPVEVVRWLDLLNQHNDVPTLTTSLQALTLIAAGDRLSVADAAALQTRLINLAALGAPVTDFAVDALATIAWATDTQNTASTAIGEHFAALTAPIAAHAAAGLASWSLGEGSFSEVLQDALVAWLTSDDRDQDQKKLASPLWKGLATGRRGEVISRLQPDVHELVDAAQTLSADELIACLIRCSVHGTFNSVVTAVPGSDVVRHALTEFVIASFDSTRAPWIDADITAAAHRVSNEEADRLATEATTQLANGHATALNASTLLVALGQRQPATRPQQEQLTNQINELLAATSPELAGRLGRAASWIPIDAFKERLKQLRSDKENQNDRAVADQFATAHRG